MITLASGLSFVDLHFQGLPRIIATGVLHGHAGVALVDPGPSSTLPALRSALAEAGISIGDVSALLITHIHLDHAGSAGVLIRENPRLGVYVHERGAPHMVDPGKLLASASRLYGNDMDRLWGEVAPVPTGSLMALRGGERISVAGRTLEVEYTPGHAVHHVSYLDRDTGIAFAGDVAGVKLTPEGIVLPPTPPPDIDLEAWRSSLDRIGRWHPDTIFVTHFGPVRAAGHLAALRQELDQAGVLAKASLSHGETDEAREAWFTAAVRRDLRRRTIASDVEAYELAARFDLNWRGLARYWRKRA
jgi:glyoxylase-like metal-dependent hydrolase (beta-lactamase superfamily II)